MNFEEELPANIEIRSHLNLINTQLLVIEGDLEFIKEILIQLNPNRTSSLQIVVATKRTRIRGKLWKDWSFKWSSIIHSNVGGVSSSTWMLGIRFKDECNINPQDIGLSKGLSRSSKDIVKHNNLGIAPT